MFLKNGYLDINEVMDHNRTLNIIIGGRGTGKTYGAIKWCIENNKKFLLLRRTKEQAELVSRPDFSPVVPVLEDMGIEYKINKTIGRRMTGIEINGELFCFAVGLTGISNIRGFNAKWIDVIIYDEFIGEAHERPIKNEDEAFFNAYETLNRNRELQGREPIRVLMLANSNKISSVYLASLGLMPRIEKMLNDEKEVYDDPRRGIYLYIVRDSPISKAKKGTALYKFTTQSYNSMAIENEFDILGSEFVQPQQMNNLEPVCRWGKLYFYRLKSMRKWYVNEKPLGNFKKQYTADKRGDDGFLESDFCYQIEEAHLQGRILYEDLKTLNDVNVKMGHY